MVEHNQENANPFIAISQTETFKCLGSECPDTCCSGWTVTIDKFTHEKWANHPNSSKFSKHLKVIDSKQSNNLDMSQVILTPESDCPFLDKSKLCNIQKEHGHDYLSYVCRSFPRANNSFFGIKEENLSLACPEAARLILKGNKPLEINLYPPSGTELNVISISAPNQSDSSSIESSTAWQLRALILQIIQNKSVSLPKRLITIGMLARNIDELLSNGNDKEKAYQITSSRYSQMLRSESDLINLTANIPNSPHVKILLLREIVKGISPYSAKNHQFHNYFSILLDVFALDSQGDSKLDESSVIDNYLKIRSKHGLHIGQENVLENYAYHLFFKELFPFQNSSCVEQFLFLAFRIYLVHEHLLALSTKEETRSTERAIEFIQKFTKLYEHTPELQKHLLNIIKQTNFNSLAHVCILLTT